MPDIPDRPRRQRDPNAVRVTLALRVHPDTRKRLEAMMQNGAPSYGVAVDQAVEAYANRQQTGGVMAGLHLPV